MPIFPFKTYLIAALAVLLVSGFGWYTVHERHVQRDKDQAALAALVAKVQAQDVIITAQAQKNVDKETLILKQVVALPAVADLGVVCHSARLNPVPVTPVANGGGDHAAVVVPADVFDPSGDLLTLARSDAALVRDLQHKIGVLRAEMLAANKAHQ